MKNITLVLLLFPIFSYCQTGDPCRFPSSPDVDAALVQVWLTAKPTQDSVQLAKIRQKKANSRHGKAVADSLWQLTIAWLTERLGEKILCEHVVGNFPHFIMDSDRMFGTQFIFHEKPFGGRDHFFSFQIYFEKQPVGGWKLVAPDFLPECRTDPSRCQFNIDEKTAKKIAKENGIQETDGYSIQVYRAAHDRPFDYQIRKPKAAGECQDSVWWLDRRTGQLSPPRQERDRHCTTYLEMVEQSPVIVEVQELGGHSFRAGNDILTSHAYRVLQVFKGDSIPDFIEVVQGGGDLKHESSSWSHGTVSFLSAGKTGLLFLQDFSRRYVHTKDAGPEYFRYKPYIPYGDQLAYGGMTPIVREARLLDPEHLLFAPIEAHTGKPRQRRQLGKVRDEKLLETMRKWGFGYRNGQPGLLVHLYADDDEPWMSVSIEAAPVPVYLDSVNIHLRYDTTLLGTKPAANGNIRVANTTPNNNFSIPKHHDAYLTDVSPGLLSLRLVSTAADRLDPHFAFQPNGYKMPAAILHLDLPAERAKALQLELVDFDEQPGGQYVDFTQKSFGPLGYVAGVSAARFRANLPLSCDKGASDTLRYNKEHRQWQTILHGAGLDDPTLEVWAPVKVVGQDGTFIPSYQRLHEWSLYRRPEGGLLLRIEEPYNKDLSQMPIRLRSGVVYLARPGDWKAGEVLEVGYLNSDN